MDKKQFRTVNTLLKNRCFLDCVGFKCPRFAEYCHTDSDGNLYFSEGSIAYDALAMSRSGLMNGCPFGPLKKESQNA